MLPLSSAVGPVVDWLWPRFFEYGGCVFVRPAADAEASASADAPVRWDDGLDRTRREALHNHIHIVDLFEDGRAAWDDEREMWTPDHPILALADALGRAMIHAWHAKLRDEFPADRFLLYYTRLSDPTVRFHRAYHGENPWLTGADLPADAMPRDVIIRDTAGKR